MKSKKILSKKTFDQQARTYDQDIKGKHARQLYPFMLQNIILTYGEKILDIGCGTGELMLQVILEDSSKKVIGIDLSEEMIHVANEKIKEKGQLILGDAENLPFEDNSFDVVYCNDSFHYYPHPIKALAEMNRVLKIGGTLIIGDCFQKGLLRYIINIFMKLGHEGNVKLYSEKEMRYMSGQYFHAIEFKIVNHHAFIMKGIK